VTDFVRFPCQLPAVAARGASSVPATSVAELVAYAKVALPVSQLRIRRLGSTPYLPRSSSSHRGHRRRARAVQGWRAGSPNWSAAADLHDRNVPGTMLPCEVGQATRPGRSPAPSARPRARAATMIEAGVPARDNGWTASSPPRDAARDRREVAPYSPHPAFAGSEGAVRCARRRAVGDTPAEFAASLRPTRRAGAVNPGERHQAGVTGTAESGMNYPCPDSRGVTPALSAEARSGGTSFQQQLQMWRRGPSTTPSSLGFGRTTGTLRATSTLDGYDGAAGRSARRAGPVFQPVYRAFDRWSRPSAVSARPASTRNFRRIRQGRRIETSPRGLSQAPCLPSVLRVSVTRAG